MVASYLLKYCHFIEDIEDDALELNFLRDNNRWEIDFVVVKNGKPQFTVECKTADNSLSKHIAYFADRTEMPYFYQVHLGERDYEVMAKRTRVLPFRTFCQLMKL